MGYKPEQKATTSQHSARDLDDMHKLAHIEGQVHSIRVMVEGDQSTAEVLFHLRAVVDALKNVALSRVGQEIGSRMDALLSRAASGDDVAQLQSLRALVIEGFRLPGHSDRRPGYFTFAQTVAPGTVGAVAFQRTGNLVRPALDDR